MTELDDSRPLKAQLVRKGLQQIVGEVGFVIGITGAVFTWTGGGGKANILLLVILVLAFLISIVVLLTYLRYEKAENRLDDIAGDLAEGYSQVRDRHSRVLADLWLFVQVIRLVPTGMKRLFGA